MPLSATELKTLLDSSDAPIVIDVLPEDAFAARHIPGATNACVYEIVFADEVSKITGDRKDAAIVVYDETGTRDTATTARDLLAASGYANVRVLEGGMRGWLDAGFSSGDADGAPPTVTDGAYPVDLEQSVIEWTGRNIGNKHYGTLKLSAGEVNVAGGRLAGGSCTIDMESLACTDIADPDSNAMLVGHLKSADFFEVETWPEAKLEIVSVERLEAPSDGLPNTRITARLTLHGATEDVAIPCLVGRSMDGDMVAQGNFDIDRTDWNIRYGSGRFFEWLGKHLVNDLINLQIKMVVHLNS